MISAALQMRMTKSGMEAKLPVAALYLLSEKQRLSDAAR
jgi:hypothetical protein